MVDFFAGFEEATISLFSESPILRSYADTWALPKTLRYVPSEFLDNTGRPLLADTSLSQKYLSTKYNLVDNWPLLSRLGVRELSTSEFLTDLETFLDQSWDDFRRRRDEWHASLCSALTHIIGRKSFRPDWRAAAPFERIARMRLIPLRNDEWVAYGTETRRICFAAGIEGETEIPRGIELVEVDPSIRKDGERGVLFIQLGVQEFSLEAACEAIVRAHRNPSFNETGLSPADLASHALFLYRSRHYDRRESRLWFVAQDGTRGRGHEFYAWSTRRFAASSWPREFQHSVRFLHEEYLSSFLEDPAGAEAWVDWLASSHGVRIFPALVSQSSIEGPSLSEDFLSLLRCSESGKVLELLKHQWHYYAGQLNCPSRGRGERTQPDTRVISELGSIQVSCQGGKVVPLDQTIIPSRNIPLALSSELNILDIPDPDDPQWWFLRILGVSSKLDAPSLIRQIRVLRDSGQIMGYVENIYRELQLLQHSERDKELLR